MKLLIDTNIIIDAMASRSPWNKSAEALILAIAEEKAEGYITAKTFTDIHYILRKHIMDKTKLKEKLLGLLTVVTALDVYGNDCEKAFELPVADYEDAFLACCGKRHKVDFIVTRNIKHFDGSPVKAVEAGDILKQLQ